MIYESNCNTSVAIQRKHGYYFDYDYFDYGVLGGHGGHGGFGGLGGFHGLGGFGGFSSPGIFLLGRLIKLFKFFWFFFLLIPLIIFVICFPQLFTGPSSVTIEKTIHNLHSSIPNKNTAGYNNIHGYKKNIFSDAFDLHSFLTAKFRQVDISKFIIVINNAYIDIANHNEKISFISCNY